MRKKTKISAYALIGLLVLTWIISPIQVSAKDPQTLGDLKGELAALKQQKATTEANKANAQSQIRANEQAILNACLNSVLISIAIFFI